MKPSNSRQRTSRFDYQTLEARQLLSANLPSVDAQIELSRDYLSKQPETQYLLDGNSELRFIEVKHGLASTTTRFQQTIDGLPVHDAIITINQGPDRAFQLVHHSLAVDETEIAFPKLENQVAIGFLDAESSAMTAAGITETMVGSRGEQAWFVDQTGEVHQVWDLMVFSGYNPVGDFLTIVDADSGAVLMQENRAAFATGTGHVFEPNPYQTQGNGAGLTDNNDANSPGLESQLISVTLQGLDDGTGLLIGEFVDLATLNSAALDDVDADEADRIYEYTRDNPRFEQVVVYHSVDQINRYFHFLGFDDDTGTPNGIRDYATLANAHWYDDDQSFYSTGDDALHFGDGGVDDGEDADIVAHEYGHAIQHNQNAAWGGGEMGSMGEGFGDYLAAAFYKTFGDFAFQADHAAAVGEWDSTSYSSDDPPNLRRVDGNKMYPNDLTGEVHADGEIWSRALWDMNANLGADYANQLILEHHFTLSANADMPTAAAAILQANENINGGEGFVRARHPFVERGILDALTLVEFDAEVYTSSNEITFYVSDVNATGSVQATVRTLDGDVEIVTLTDTGNGLLFGKISSSNTPLIAGDGQLNLVSALTDITVTYIDAGLTSAVDTAVIETELVSISGTTGDDIIYVEIDDVVMIDVNGEVFFIDSILQQSLIFDAKGGYDRITILDSSGNDTALLRNDSVNIAGFFGFAGQSVESIELISGGGVDEVRMFGSDGDDVFETFDNRSTLIGDDFSYGATNYNRTFAFALDGNDQASFSDSPGNDRFNFTPIFSNLTTATNKFVNARGFDQVNASATNGGYDIASLMGGDGDDRLFASPTMTRLETAGLLVRATGFDRTSASGGAGHDTAFLVGSDGNDVFNSRPYNSYLSGAGYFNQARSFEQVTATSGTAGNDRAILRDSPGEDTFYATSEFAVLYSSQFRNQANGFDRVSAFGTAGMDRATMVDTLGDDRYVARPSDAYLIGAGYLNYVKGFNRVSVTSTGGDDVAVLTGSNQDDRFLASRAAAYISGETGGTYFNWAANFSRVTLNLSGGGLDIGIMEDSSGNDTLIATKSQATLYNDDYLVFVQGIERLTAYSNKGGIDKVFENALNFKLDKIGNWV